MPVDRHVVGGIGEYHGRRGALHQRRMGHGIGRIPTDDAVPSQHPKIPACTDGRPIIDGRDGICPVRPIHRPVVQAIDAQINLCNLEPRCVEGEFKIKQRQIPQLLGQELVVPLRDLG